jgi:hypothetical protein
LAWERLPAVRSTVRCVDGVCLLHGSYVIRDK